MVSFEKFTKVTKSLEDLSQIDPKGSPTGNIEIVEGQPGKAFSFAYRTNTDEGWGAYKAELRRYNKKLRKGYDLVWTSVSTPTSRGHLTKILSSTAPNIGYIKT